MDLRLCLAYIVSLLSFAQTKVIHIDEDDSKKPERGPEQTQWLEKHLSLFQTELEVAKANYSLQRHLPGQQIDAQLAEAQARQAKAQKEYLQAKQLLEDPPKTRINVGYVGRGYDIFYGNPLPDEGVVDRGFRLPILELTYSTGKVSADGRYLVPDMVDIVSEPSATFSSSLHEVSTIHDYQHMLSTHASVSASAGYMGIGAHFSASTSYSSQQREFSQGQSIHVDLIGRATVYHARLAASTHTFKVSNFFQDAMAVLPDQVCTDEASLQPYQQVIRDFGTHFTTGVTMGATSVQRLYMKTSDVRKFSKEGVSASVAAGASGGFFGCSFSASASAGFSMSDSTKNEIKKMDKQTIEYYIGGTPPDGNVSQKGSTDHLKAWAKTAADNPAPVMYQLLSVDELLKSDSVFTASIPGLIKKRECLMKAIASYCMKHSADPNTCLDKDIHESRRKRSLDDKGGVNITSNAIKYGDYVRLSNTNDDKTKTDLVFKDERQWASDEPVCYGLGTASKINQSENLFQLLPPSGKDELLGTPLRYGQPFRLNGRRGQHIILGTQKFQNVSYIETATLEYFFNNINLDTHKYDGKLVLCAPDPFTDVYVFRLYTVSGLCAFINASIQVILEGQKGTFTEHVVFPYTLGSLTIIRPFLAGSVGTPSTVTLKVMPGSNIGYDCKMFIGLIDVKAKKIYKQWPKPEFALSFAEQQEKTLILTSQNFDIGSISDALDDSHYVEMELHSREKNKGPGTIVEDDDEGVLHVKTDRPRDARYWGFFPPDLLQAETDGDVTVTEQIFGSKPHSSHEHCLQLLEYPWTRETVREISSGSLKNGSYFIWEFSDEDKQKSVKFTFQSLSRVSQLVLTPELKTKTNVRYRNRNDNDWMDVTFTINKDKSGDVNVIKRDTFEIQHIVTDAIQFNFESAVQNFNILELGIIGCFLSSQGVDIRDKIPNSLLWTIDLQDVEVTTDPVFAVAKKSSVPHGIPDVDSDAQKEDVKVQVKMADGVTTCNIDDETLSPVIQTILGRPPAIFMDFKGNLKKQSGSVYLTLEFTVVSYSSSQRELLKAEILRKVSQSGRLMPCNKPSTGYALQNQGGTSSGLRPVDYFLIIVATTALLILLAVAAVFLRRRVVRKPGYKRLESSTSYANGGEGGGSQQVPVESVITIVDHVMARLKEENAKKEKETKKKTRSDTASVAGEDADRRINKRNQSDGDREIRTYPSTDLARFSHDTQTRV